MRFPIARGWSYVLFRYNIQAAGTVALWSFGLIVRVLLCVRY